MEPEWKEVDINSRIHLSIPEGMILSAAPNPHALAHYEDTMHSTFLIVISESKDTMAAYELDYNLSTYFDEVCREISGRLSGAVISQVHSEKINGSDAFLGKISGTFGNKQIGYVLGGIETPKNFYQIITAFPVTDSVRFTPEMEQVIRSFREL